MEFIEDTLGVGALTVGALLIVWCVVRAVRDRSTVPLIQARLGLVGGLVAGTALFVAARLAMRIVVLAAGLELTLTLEGNLFILGVVVFLGMPAGLVFVLVAPRSWRTKGLTYGGALSVIFFPVFFGFGAGDLEEAGITLQILAVALVSLSWLIFGLVLASVVERLDSVRSTAGAVL